MNTLTSRRSAILVALLCLACLLLGASLGNQLFGCKEDELGSDHVFFRAEECFNSVGDDGSRFLDCRRAVMP